MNYGKYIKKSCDQFKIVRRCKICGYTETIKRMRGTGKGSGINAGCKARTRMIKHIITHEPIEEPKKCFYCGKPTPLSIFKQSTYQRKYCDKCLSIRLKERAEELNNFKIKKKCKDCGKFMNDVVRCKMYCDDCLIERRREALRKNRLKSKNRYPKVCKLCNKKFNSSYKGVKFCSKSCATKYNARNRKSVKTKCLECSKSFRRIANHNHVYCSDCKQKVKNKKQSERRMELTSSAVKGIIAGQIRNRFNIKIKHDDIPIELVSAKRKQIQLSRLIKQLKQGR